MHRTCPRAFPNSCERSSLLLLLAQYTITDSPDPRGEDEGVHEDAHAVGDEVREDDEASVGSEDEVEEGGEAGVLPKELVSIRGVGFHSEP